MSQNNDNQKPEVYALKKGEDSWQFDRRDFLKAAALGTAAVSAGINAGLTPKRVLADDQELAGLCVNMYSHESQITAMALSPDGKWLVSGDQKGAVKLWTFPEGVLKATNDKNSTKKVSVLAFSASGENVYVNYEMSKFDVLSASNLKRTSGVEMGTSFSAIATAPDGRIFAASYVDKLVYILTEDSVKAGKKSVDSIDIGSHRPTSLAYLEGEDQLLVGCFDGPVLLYDLKSKEKIDSFGDDSQDMCSLAVVPGNTRFLCGGYDGVFQLISIRDKTTLWRDHFQTDSIFAVAVSPDGSTGFIQSGSGKIGIIGIKTGDQITSIEDSAGRGSQLCVTADGLIMASSVYQSIHVWSLPDGKMIGCPFDLKSVYPQQEGIEVERVDEETGRTETFTLPCGSDIPDGAVCICNCVAGSNCSCVGYVPCSCDGYTCSCVGNVCTCDGHTVTSHYWYPD